MMKNILSRISEEYDNFTYSQKTVANFVMENLNLIAFDTLEDLAARIKVSTTTIIRFARSLGYNGYSEMQKDIQSNLKNKIRLPERLNESMSRMPQDELLRESFQNDITNIEETLKSLDMADLQDAVGRMIGAENVYIIGLRGSFALAHYTASRLGQIRKNVRLVQSVGMLYPEELISAGPKDVCIAFLFPRYSKSTANMIAWLKKRQVKIIRVTSQNSRNLDSAGEIVFPCSVRGSSFKNSYAAPLCLINYFAAAVAAENYEEAKGVLEETEEFLSQGFYLEV